MTCRMCKDETEEMTIIESIEEGYCPICGDLKPNAKGLEQCILELAQSIERIEASN